MSTGGTMGGPRVALTAAVLLLFLSASPANAGPVAHLTLTSEPGDHVGQGGSFDFTYTPANSDFFFASVLSLPPVPSFLDFVLGTATGGADDTFATLSFSTTQLGIAITAGFYPDAERAAFAAAGHPGLEVTFQNRGCNTLTGSFSVDEVTFSPEGLIDTLSAQFEQHCEGAAPALFGTFTFEAEVPEPAVVALVTCGLLLARRRLRAAR
jgi:hypothetical protein